MRKDTQPYFLTVRDFGAIYGVGKTKTYALIAAGDLEARKVGSRTLITAESARRWAAGLPHKAQKAP